MFKHLLSSRFARNVALVATGTAGAQAITMAFSPAITRLYGPEAFGLLGTFTATLAIVTPIAALNYPIAIVLPKKDDDARGIAKLSVLLAFFISLAAAVILLFGDQAIAQSLILNSAKSGVGFIHPAGAALIVLATLGSALYAAQLWLGARRWTAPEDHINRPKEQLSELRSLAHQHRDFPIYRALQVAINSFSQSLPVLMRASFFGPVTLMYRPSKNCPGHDGKN